ncbi:hypothetical protein [Hymenobacter coccineus]|uniref:hypothetical protein n=1 Tax=Hymenobacter coccineus TaxID=1908235 RepID=UPI001955E650|nr:hypothetical protein [Hymenobacter coccineus]
MRGGRASQAFQSWIDEINDSVNEQLIPALKVGSMLLSDAKYVSAGMTKDYMLTQVSDFNSLIAYSQKAQTPVFALAANQLVSGGKARERQELSIRKFKKIFNELALKIIEMTN